MTMRIPVIQIEPPSQAIVDATQHNPAIRLYKGFYQLLRRIINLPLIGLFLLAPWLMVNDAPLLWMDIGGKKLHLLGLILWPSDLTALIWIALASAFALFTAANFAGRIWCGFACPQTIWSMMFSWIEEKVQGSRNHRLKQLSLPWNKRLTFRLILKHVIWLLLAFMTAFTFVAYFETGPQLWQQLKTGNLIDEQIFWLVFFAALTYINAGLLREQVCLHMCPYARFQSVMLDEKSLKVSYDQQRGEPRKPTKTTPSKLAKIGDCIDCTLCVQVCPVGIDIRHGMQYACIDCGACIDACDDIMEKTQQPSGLIRFSNGHSKKWTSILNKRARLYGYSALTLLCVFGFLLQIFSMESFDAHLSRDRDQLFFYDQAGHIQNAYWLTIQNKTNENVTYSVAIDHASLRITPDKLSHISIAAQSKIPHSMVLSCQAPCTLNSKTPFKIIIRSQQPDSSMEAQELSSVFFAP